MSSSENSYWCYSCREPVHVLREGNQEPFCPYCNEGFVIELDDMETVRPREFFPPTHFDNVDQRFRIMEAFAAYMRQRFAGDVRSVPSQGHGSRYGSGSQSGSGPNSAHGPPMFVFGGQIPSRLPDSGSGGFEVLFNGAPGIGFTRGNVANYFMGPGLEELLDQILVSDRRGPPPASRPSIDAMPTVRITRRHLAGSDSHCSICQEKFEMGGEAREMPCGHIYHSDCIVPWLVRHNSCPVCRHELPAPGPANGGRRNFRSPGHERGRREGRRNPFSFLWPFHSSGSSGSGEGQDESSRRRGGGSSGGNVRYDECPPPGWPFD